MFRLPCKDYLKGTCTNPFCEKWHPPVCLFYKSEMDADLGKSALMRIARLKNSQAKGLEKNGWQKCSGNAEKYTTFGLRISGCGAAEVFIDCAEELKHTEANPMCSIHESRRRSRWHSRQKSIAWNDLPRWSSSAQPQCSFIWGMVSGRDRMTRAMCPWSSVQAGQKCVKIKGAWKSNILFTFGK